ncbi:helicase-related protein [Candidatus Desulfovibrio trichonymphae]|uniref:helicase-related protein n=1 Tax=Candidatus Desulfovibrio trichonymphae TaxID=1725232 RepID=UPI0018D55E1D|nr:DEAD/DEAH box helicase [Candidatus Desulfovibrio trichonymphae]
MSSSSIDRIESAVSGNVFVETNLCIARLDKLSRNEEIQEKLRITDWDLIVCEEKFGKQAAEYAFSDDYDEDDLPSGELEATEENVADQASAASTIRELEAEISTLKQLESMANAVRVSGENRKWEELSGLLQNDKAMFDGEGLREKLIIFTEHRDTLRYLTEKIRSLFGHDKSVVVIHGGVLRDARRKVEELFKQDKDMRILIATDAAGEGINLQRAHLMVNYDLPWNPTALNSTSAESTA